MSFIVYLVICFQVIVFSISYICESWEILEWIRRKLDGIPLKPDGQLMNEKEYEIALFSINLNPYMSGVRDSIDIDWLFPGGYLGTPIGMVEDWLRFIANDNFLLSSVFASKSNPFTLTERRFNNFVLINIGFYSFCMTNLSFSTSTITVIILNIFFVCPLLILMTKVLYFSLVCPCFVGWDRSTNCFTSLFKSIGYCFGWVIAFISVVTLLYGTAAVGSQIDNTSEALLFFTQYLNQILLMQSLQQLILESLAFVDTTSKTSCGRLVATISVFLNFISCGGLGIGRWFEKREEVRIHAPEFIKETVHPLYGSSL
jgi:hypothetical protein